ncbi:hypothetical protein HZI73_15650 [Vallitalea pronyensis]|uniref:Uncharacterized protein n=1 Tax=Vallitalea pronyensis TaxID=1348613 RepID=A0A8J8SH94_9FIRM|nr:hypothetical protein [Vallitalea pronyensis]QUI23635.1 hypothetical protein HZI73_15650 [Vallitalea pronyensis]
MKEKLHALLEVRKIGALLVVMLFLVLSALGKIDADKSYSIIIMVVTFYFGKSTALDRPE